MVGDVSLIEEFFPELSEEQRRQLAALGPLYEEWNAKINVVSRQDLPNLYEHHVLHSLALARLLGEFTAGAKRGFGVLDVGTGGGFPGIPLAIVLPEFRFTLIDSVRKKVGVCQAVIDALKLGNARAFWRNAVEERGRWDFVVSRAVCSCAQLVQLTSHLKGRRRMLVLKGGDLREEIAGLEKLGVEDVGVQAISDYFPLPYFEEKKIVYWQC